MGRLRCGVWGQIPHSSCQPVCPGSDGRVTKKLPKNRAMGRHPDISQAHPRRCRGAPPARWCKQNPSGIPTGRFAVSLPSSERPGGLSGTATPGWATFGHIADRSWGGPSRADAPNQAISGCSNARYVGEPSQTATPTKARFVH